MPACTTVSKKCEENGAIIAKDIVEKGEADAVILTSTWGTSTRCGSTIARQIEKLGVPTVQITAVPNIAEMVGVNRILTGVAVPNPVGDPSLTPDQEKILRRKIVDKALEMLQTDYEKSTVVTMD